MNPWRSKAGRFVRGLCMSDVLRPEPLDDLAFEQSHALRFAETATNPETRERLLDFARECAVLMAATPPAALAPVERVDRAELERRYPSVDDEEDVELLARALFEKDAKIESFVAGVADALIRKADAGIRYERERIFRAQQTAWDRDEFGKRAEYRSRAERVIGRMEALRSRATHARARDEAPRAIAAAYEDFVANTAAQAITAARQQLGFGSGIALERDAQLEQVNSLEQLDIVSLQQADELRGLVKVVEHPECPPDTAFLRSEPPDEVSFGVGPTLIGPPSFWMKLKL